MSDIGEPEEVPLPPDDFNDPSLFEPPDTPASDLNWIPTPAIFHHAYSVADEDTDLVLKSSDDDDFHVNSIVLKLSSSVFRNMLAMPRPEDSAEAKHSESVSLSESADVLRLLLDIIYPGRGLLEGMDGPFEPALLPRLKSVGLAAIKYDMVTALGAIRTFLVSKSSIERYNAVQLYGIAWDLEFLQEAKMLSTETLKCNLGSLDIQAYLENMSVMAVLKLQQLHRQRKVIMLNSLHEIMDNQPYYRESAKNYGVNTIGTYAPISFARPWQLSESNRQHYYREAYQWSLIFHEASRIMEEHPDGWDFFSAESEFFYQEKFAELSSICDMRMLSREFRRILDWMPKEIMATLPWSL